jgi:hypothetical protein
MLSKNNNKIKCLGTYTIKKENGAEIRKAGRGPAFQLFGCRLSGQGR